MVGRIAFPNFNGRALVGLHGRQALNHRASALELGLRRIRRFAEDESGVTAIEYGLLGALTASFVVGAVSLTGSNLLDLYAFVRDEVSTAIAGVL
jgi:pilus assembly protein Flp/PilA